MNEEREKHSQEPKTSSSLHSIDKNLRKELLEKEKKDLQTEREEKKKIAGPSTAKRLQYIKNRIEDINRQLDTERHARLLERNHLNYLRRLEKKKKHRIIMENSSEDITSDALTTQSSHQVVLPPVPALDMTSALGEMASRLPSGVSLNINFQPNQTNNQTNHYNGGEAQSGRGDSEQTSPVATKSDITRLENLVSEGHVLQNEVLQSVQQNRAPPSSVRQARSVGVEDRTNLFGYFNGSSPSQTAHSDGDAAPMGKMVDTSTWLRLRDIAEDNSLAIAQWTDILTENIEIPDERFVTLQELDEHNFDLHRLLQFLGQDIIRAEDKCAFMLGSSDTSLFHPHVHAEEIITQFFDCACLPRLHSIEVEFDLPDDLQSDPDDMELGAFSVTVASCIAQCANNTVRLLLKVFFSSKDVTKITVEGTESKDQLDSNKQLRKFLLPASDIGSILQQLPERETLIVLKVTKFGFDTDQVEELRSLKRYKVDINFYSCHEIKPNGTCTDLDDEQEEISVEEIARREYVEDREDPCSHMEDWQLGGPGAQVRPRDMASTWHEIGFVPNQNCWQCVECYGWNSQNDEDGNLLTTCPACHSLRTSESTVSPTAVMEPTSGLVVHDAKDEDSNREEAVTKEGPTPKKDMVPTGTGVESSGASSVTGGGFQFVHESSSTGNESVSSAFHFVPPSALTGGGFRFPVPESNKDLPAERLPAMVESNSMKEVSSEAPCNGMAMASTGTGFGVGSADGSSGGALSTSGMEAEGTLFSKLEAKDTGDLKGAPANVAGSIEVEETKGDNAGEQESQADETEEEKSHGDEHRLIMVRRRSRRGLEPEMEMQDNPEQFLRCRARRDKNGNCQG